MSNSQHESHDGKTPLQLLRESCELEANQIPFALEAASVHWWSEQNEDDLVLSLVIRDRESNRQICHLIHVNRVVLSVILEDLGGVLSMK